MWRRIYLNPPAFWLRSLIALAGWLLFAMLLLRGPVSRLTAALGLVFYWAFQLCAGLRLFGFSRLAPRSFRVRSSRKLRSSPCSPRWRCAALAAPATGRRHSEIRSWRLPHRRVASACLYSELMAFIVNWYGNLPEQAQWVSRTARPVGAYAVAAAALLGAAIPIVALLWSSVRASGIALRRIGVLVLAGVMLHTIWLFAPIATPLALVSAAISILAMAAALIALEPIGGGFPLRKETQLCLTIA